jgi:surface antigen
MQNLVLSRAAKGRLALAAVALSAFLLLNPDPAAAQQGCGGGALSTSSGNLIGSAVGGAAGGVLGNQFGRGSGNAVMTGLGVVGGALAGGYVGRQMEGCGSAARPAATAPSSYRPAPRPATRHARATRTCRFVETQAQIDGRMQPIDAVACLEPDGSWQTASGSEAQQAAEYDLVLRAQQQLRQQGFYVRDNVDGEWGPATSAAVRNFQRANGIAPSGELDMATRGALGLNSTASAAANVSAPAPVAAPSSAVQVKAAQ